MPHQHGIEHGIVVVFEVVLFEHRHAFPRSHLDAAFGGLELATDGAKEGRFACTIGADNAIDIAGGELDIYVFV